MNGYERAEARDKIRKMHGTEVHWACVRLLHCLKIVIKNSHNLQKFSLNPPKIHYKLMPDIKSRIQKNDLDSEAIRLIHNFLASVKTLVDNSRRVSDKYLESNLKEQYIEEIKMKILSDPISLIVLKLRNYLLHVDMPSIENQVNIETGNNTALKLCPKRLLEWSKWNSVEREYLECLVNNGEKIVVHNFFPTYTVKSEKITCYLLKLVTQSKGDELNALYKLNQKLIDSIKDAGNIADPLFVHFWSQNKQYNENGAEVPLFIDGKLNILNI